MLHQFCVLISDLLQMSPCSGNTHDDMLLAKFETVYTGAGDHASSLVCIFEVIMNHSPAV